MRWVLMGRKREAARALEHSLERGHQVRFAVTSEPGPEGPLEQAARRRGMPLLGDEQAYTELDRERAATAMVVSYLHQRKIRPPLIEFPRVGCFNFHPAPLPEMCGVGGYNFAIPENRAEYGVCVHWVAPEIDAGDLVWVRRFRIEPSQETAWSLERKAKAALWELFVEFVELVERGRRTVAACGWE